MDQPELKHQMSYSFLSVQTFCRVHAAQYIVNNGPAHMPPKLPIPVGVGELDSI